MKKLINEWQNFVNEEIYSSNAVVYHGTNSVANVKSILKNGYSLDKNRDAMYGKGLYTVYELEDTNTGAGIYGDVILKFKVDLKPGRFIILDEKEAKKVHGDDWKLRDQAQKFDLDLSKEIYEEYQKVMQYINPMTSDIAKKIAKYFGGRGKRIDEIDGIVFTGRNDGPVCVVYNPEKSDLIAWKNISRKESVNEGDLVKFSYTHVNDIEQRLVNLKRSLDDKLLYGDEPANF